jgi:group I intron endonuclease
MKVASGIYLIRHRESGNSYVGSSVNIPTRWKQHRYVLRRGNHPAKYLQNSWNKYGPDAFEFSVLEEVAGQSRLIEREQAYIDLWKPVYNVAQVAGSRFGVPQSDECKAKGSAFHSVYWKVAENIARRAAAIKAGYTEEGREAHRRHSIETASHERLNTPEARAKATAAMQGRAPAHLHTPEVRAKISVSLRRYREEHPEVTVAFAEWARGQSPSAETRELMRQAKLGKPLTEEHRRKIGDANRGQPWARISPECRAATIAANTGRKQSPEHIAKRVATITGMKKKPHSDETKAKISASLTGRIIGPPSKEHRRKIGEKNAAHWAAKRSPNFEEERRLANNARAARYRERKAAKDSSAA